MPALLRQPIRQAGRHNTCMLVCDHVEQALSAAIIMMGVGLLFLEFGHRLKC